MHLLTVFLEELVDDATVVFLVMDQVLGNGVEVAFAGSAGRQQLLLSQGLGMTVGDQWWHFCG